MSVLSIINKLVPYLVTNNLAMYDTRTETSFHTEKRQTILKI